MRRGMMLVGGTLLALALAPPAGAQGYFQNGFGQQQRPYTIEVPPPSLGINSPGLLERDFQQMRRTSPNPNAFMGGRWNPGRITVYPSTSFITPGFGFGYGGGYGYPYGGYYGGVFLPSPYGNGYGGAYGGYGSPGGGYGGITNYNYNLPPQASAVTPVPQTVPDTNAAVKPVRPGDDYYLRGSQTAESLSDALDDIRKAWMNGDLGRLQARVPTDGKVKIFSSGEYRYSLDGKEFVNLLRDAMKRIDTVSFELDRPTTIDRNRARVTGRHTYVVPDKTRETVSVSYVLELSGGRWTITEAGSSRVTPARESD